MACNCRGKKEAGEYGSRVAYCQRGTKKHTGAGRIGHHSWGNDFRNDDRLFRGRLDLSPSSVDHSTHPARNLLPFFLLLTNCDAGDMDESVGLLNLFGRGAEGGAGGQVTHRSHKHISLIIPSLPRTHTTRREGAS